MCALAFALPCHLKDAVMPCSECVWLLYFGMRAKKKNTHSLSWKQLLTLQVVVIKQHDEGNKEHGFPYVIAAGIERYPLKVNKRMGAKKLARRSKIKPFVKVCFVSNPR